MSRTAPSARLPAVGTVFPSLLDFKIAVFRAAEAGSFQVRVFSCCRARHAVLNCIGCGSKPAVEKGLLTACTCRVRAYKSKHGGGFEVRSATAAHSCVVPAYNSVEGRANRKDMHVRVVTLEAERDGESSSDSGAAEETDDLSSVTDSASGSDSNAKRVTVTTQSGRQSILTDRYGSTLPPPKRMKRTAAPVKQDERSLNRHSTPAFSKRLLMKEIEKLAEGPPLSLPAPSDTFSDPRALLLRIYTWSHQRSICLNHGDYVGRITFICKPTSQGPRCPFEISMTEADDGEWSVTDWKREHDMALHGWDEENQKENEPAGPSQVLPDRRLSPLPSPSGFPQRRLRPSQSPVPRLPLFLPPPIPTLSPPSSSLSSRRPTPARSPSSAPSSPPPASRASRTLRYSSCSTMRPSSS